MLLNCHTYYSFCYGTLSPEELRDEVLRKGYSSYVLSDINNTSACIDSIRLAVGQNVKPVPGIDFRNGNRQCYVGIARNNEGFKELNEHLSRHLHEGLGFELPAPEFQHAYIIYPAGSYSGWALREYEFIGVSLKDLPRLPFMKAARSQGKFVALQPLTFIRKRDYNAHRLLRAISQNTLLSKLAADEQAGPEECIPARNELYAAYAAYPSLIQNTERILEDSGISLEYGKFSNKNLHSFTGSVAEDIALLRRECVAALPYRYPDLPHEIIPRMEKELEVIGKMDFAFYFLINRDIINYARRKNYYYVGRGSGANSMVAYLLRITDVDPVDLDLYFERFINPYRSNPPDFDIDFSWTDRDDVTRYIFERFGYERTALLGAYSTFQHDAVIRELGKVFGLPAREIDQLQSADGSAKTGELGNLVLRYSKLIHGFPRHLSVHSSGIIISHEPISCYTATILPPKGYPTTQFSMLEAEDIGLYKLDILSQRGLGKIKDTLEIVRENKGAEIDIHNIARFKEDETVKQLLSEGKCIGCFYIESPAMRMLLAKLQADDYRRLVAASSIIRPGVSKSGMMRAYILRYRNEEVRKKAQEEMPELYELLKETYGVMVYQEDVIKVAHCFAGLSLAEADYLRRGMSWKFKKRNEFAQVQENFFGNCRAKGYPEKTINDIWMQIESFANYAFSKGHSASYAVESYQALFLKAHFPLEYMVATLNNGGGFYRTDIYLHEARMHGATIVAPCINTSESKCVIRGTTIYLGLNMIAELEQELQEKILSERSREGSFQNLVDFVKRVPVSIEQLRLLIRIDAFRFTGKTKQALLWEAHSLISQAKKSVPSKELFDVKPKSYSLPDLSVTWLDNAMDERELLGFSLCSPFYLLRDGVPTTLTAKELLNHIGKVIDITGYLVTVKNTGTSKGERMCFGTFIDVEGNWIDTVHFPPSIRSWPFTGPGCYKLRGKVVEEFDFVSLEIIAMKRLPYMAREDVPKAGGNSLIPKILPA